MSLLALRFARSIAVSKRRSPVGIWDRSDLPMRVRLGDIDLLGHMNNSAYLVAFDLARFDLIHRSGFWPKIRAQKIYAVVAAQTITYRKSLKWRQRYTVETRIAGVDDRSTYFQHRVVVGGEIYAEGVVRQRFLGPQGPVPTADMLKLCDPLPADRVIAPWMEQWATNTLLPSTRKPAPSTWPQ